MKAYVLTTGVIFALLTVAHIWRVIEEGRHLTEPWYILLTVAVAALSVWAWRLLWRLRRP